MGLEVASEEYQQGPYCHQSCWQGHLQACMMQECEHMYPPLLHKQQLTQTDLKEAGIQY